MHVALLFCSVISAATWPMDTLSTPPRVWPAQEYSAQGVSALFYEGVPFQGHETRVFAWYGEPKHTPDVKVPAVVLVHGGGGTAFAEWVRIWNEHGYAAIAMDLSGRTGVDTEGDPQPETQHEWPGPNSYGYPGSSTGAIEDSWVYHSVSAIIRANSLLRTMKAVDPDRIGIVGISWGGFMSGIVAGVDHRFAFAVPIYGCGFVNEAPLWRELFWDPLGPELARQWFDRYDPSHFLPRIICPTLWINGASDKAFTLNIHKKSYEICGGDKTLSIRTGLKHSHIHGWRIRESYAFADSICSGVPSLIDIAGHSVDSGCFQVEYNAPATPYGAYFSFTSDTEDWETVEWKTFPATLDLANHRAFARIPPGTVACFMNITDANGLTVSTVYENISSDQILSLPQPPPEKIPGYARFEPIRKTYRGGLRGFR